MSLVRPSGGPSPPPEDGALPEPGRPAVVETLGAGLLDALELHLPGAREHAEATAAFAFAIAAELGWGREGAELVRESARLHDVGMVYVPVETLRRPLAAQDDDDRALLRSHIEAGARLALGAGLPEEICEWIIDTRERWDGGGPKNLRGSEIPAQARVIRVACAADLLLRDGGLERTVASLRAGAGAELDPLAVGAAIAVLERATAP